jgi:hypothetical protein
LQRQRYPVLCSRNVSENKSALVRQHHESPWPKLVLCALFCTLIVDFTLVSASEGASLLPTPLLQVTAVVTHWNTRAQQWRLAWRSGL